MSLVVLVRWISIPEGAIKRVVIDPQLLLFLLISIPEGAIKRLRVQTVG